MKTFVIGFSLIAEVKGSLEYFSRFHIARVLLLHKVKDPYHKLSI